MVIVRRILAVCEEIVVSEHLHRFINARAFVQGDANGEGGNYIGLAGIVLNCTAATQRKNADEQAGIIHSVKATVNGSSSRDRNIGRTVGERTCDKSLFVKIRHR